MENVSGITTEDKSPREFVSNQGIWNFVLKKNEAYFYAKYSTLNEFPPPTTPAATQNEINKLFRRKSLAFILKPLKLNIPLYIMLQRKFSVNL